MLGNFQFVFWISSVYIWTFQSSFWIIFSLYLNCLGSFSLCFGYLPFIFGLFSQSFDVFGLYLDCLGIFSLCFGYLQFIFGLFSQSFWCFQFIFGLKRHVWIFSVHISVYIWIVASCLGIGVHQLWKQKFYLLFSSAGASLSAPSGHCVAFKNRQKDQNKYKREINKLAKLRRCASRVHFAKTHFG